MKLDDAKELQNTYKTSLNEIPKGRPKSQEQKSALENIKLLYKSRRVVIKLVVIIVQLYLKLNTKQNMEKVWKYYLLKKCFKDYQ